VPIAGSGVGSADADVVQAAGHSQRDGAGLIDAVAAYAVVGVGAGASNRRGFLYVAGWPGVILA